MDESGVLIVGAGLAGLCCARRLAQAGVPCTLLEAGDDVGGRVRTDRVEGFLLDRGFQVFLTAYPEARRVLDYDSLRLRTFTPGALVRADGELRRIADPWRNPVDGARSLLQGVIGVGDVLPLARIRLAIARASAEVEAGESSLWTSLERSTLDELRHAGVSERAIERFFRPFFGGVFFDRPLETSSRMFRFTSKMFAEGHAAIPEGGMRAIPDQLRALLEGRAEVRLGSPVESVRPDGLGVLTRRGEELAASAVVVATEGSEAQRLLGDAEGHGGVGFRGWQSTATMYFAAERPPIDEPILVLDGDGRGPVNHLCVPSEVAPTYAPAGASLVSASIVGEPGEGWAAAQTAVTDQMRSWFGSAVDRWRHLRTYRIAHALPSQPAGGLQPPRRPVRIRPRVYACGDHRDNASINGAMESGRRAAEAVLADLGLAETEARDAGASVVQG